MAYTVRTADENHGVIQTDRRAICQWVIEPAGRSPLFALRVEHQDRIEPDLLTATKYGSMKIAAADHDHRATADPSHLAAARLRQLGKVPLLNCNSGLFRRSHQRTKDRCCRHELATCLCHLTE